MMFGAESEPHSSTRRQYSHNSYNNIHAQSVSIILMWYAHRGRGNGVCYTYKSEYAWLHRNQTKEQSTTQGQVEGRSKKQCGYRYT